MNQTARTTHPPVSGEDIATTAFSLRVESTGVEHAMGMPTEGCAAGKQHCLVYRVPLEHPKIPSTLERRLNLKQSLAGKDPSRNASILARDPHFWDYLQQFNLTAYDGEIDARRSRHFINRICRVGGRHELDRESAAGQSFFTLIEQPFLDWLFACESP